LWYPVIIGFELGIKPMCGYQVQNLGKERPGRGCFREAQSSGVRNELVLFEKLTVCNGSRWKYPIDRLMLQQDGEVFWAVSARAGLGGKDTACIVNSARRAYRNKLVKA